MRAVCLIFLLTFSSVADAKNFTNSPKIATLPYKQKNAKFSTESPKGISMQKLNKFQFRRSHSSDNQKIFPPKKYKCQ